MSGIVGLLGRMTMPMDILRRMSCALSHRGAEETIVEMPGLAMALRGRPGKTPAVVTAGVPGSRVAAVMDGRLYNAAELAAGAGFRDLPDDLQLVNRLFASLGDDFVGRLRGQFAVAVWDAASRKLLLARDHFGICPLHWYVKGDVLLFASEIKALLASGLVERQVDMRGINHVWTFFGTPGPVTCFQNISALCPGQLLTAHLPDRGAIGTRLRNYWKMDFPDAGHEDESRSQVQLLDEYGDILSRCVTQRLTADPAVGMYSSGGLDSSLLLAMGAKARTSPIDTYTFSIQHPNLDESALARNIGQLTQSSQHVLELTGDDLVGAFPRLVQAAESPVIDVSALALLQLAEHAAADGRQSIITGEGADEFQAGYPWFRIQERLDRIDWPPLWLGQLGFKRYVRLVHSRKLPWSFFRRSRKVVGERNAWMLAYTLMTTAKYEFFSRGFLESLGDHLPVDDLALDHDRLRRWSSLNRSIYLGARVHLPGLHLAARGDRAAGRSGIETRYPFLDRDVFDFLAPLSTHWKLRGLTDKFLQRQLAERWLPATVTSPRKSLLHAPLDAFHRTAKPAWALQLLSESALRKTPYFDAAAVSYWLRRAPTMRHGFRRLFIEMGLVGVLSTQLWHQSYIDSNLT
jgi:asparagine synthase (glutamine-hydrolysing)